VDSKPHFSQDHKKILPKGRPLRDLPEILASLPHLSEEEAAIFALDIEAAKAELPRYRPSEVSSKGRKGPKGRKGQQTPERPPCL